MSDSIEQRVAKLEEQVVIEKEAIKWLRSTVDEGATIASDYRAQSAFLTGIFVGLIIAVFIFN
ncbi:hypothetical protein KB976_002741 [Vibrio parahaemolyticus]|nr:hypothetical protein [Vibrio parahaemolyticus]